MLNIYSYLLQDVFFKLLYLQFVFVFVFHTQLHLTIKRIIQLHFLTTEST